MKKKLIHLTHTALLFLWCFPAVVTNTYAQSVSLDQLKQHWGPTLGGAVTTIALHEAGHLLVAGIEDADPYFDGLTIKYNQFDGSDRQGLRLSSAGFQAQWITSEYAFRRLKQSDLNDQQKAWNAGLILGHIGITAAYLTFLKDEEFGDVTGIANATGLSNSEVIALLTIPAILDTWRLFGEQSPKWAAWTSKGYKVLGITAIWTF